ncbi:MAG: glycosyltransferase family 4 protein [Alphaproteobacteria bacterium]|nr:glycosyltransferase family 4 protein [Alphaproteobacteria bacterium]
MTVAFYAPLKSPNHPTPSGDRRIANLVLEALSLQQIPYTVVSEFRSFNKTGDSILQKQLEAAAKLERNRLREKFLQVGPPKLWLTYHLYHKAPDLLGPELAREFHIPYCVIEASDAPKQEKGPWARGLQLSRHALNLAGRVFCLNPDDIGCIRPHLPEWCEIINLPPFIDPKPYQTNIDLLNRDSIAREYNLDPSDIWAISVAMMRKGDKTKSYEMLAEAWRNLSEDACSLLLVGDGENRAYIEGLFKDCPCPVRFLGQKDNMKIAQILQLCDLYVWPGIKEAFGLSLLEAQAAGLPVISANRAGIANIVPNQQAGILCPEGDLDSFCQAILTLLDDENLRHQMSHNAENNIIARHSIKAASHTLRQGLPL